MTKYTREHQRQLAVWSLDCAERVLPMFEAAQTGDSRPRDALRVGRDWVSSGTFSMAVIRGASLGAHAAAKGVGTDPAASAAAHAAGQAVATAHVPQHAFPKSSARR
jgi:hypothetical protein